MTSPTLGSAPCSPLCDAAYARLISMFPLLSPVQQGGAVADILRMQQWQTPPQEQFFSLRRMPGFFSQLARVVDTRTGKHTARTACAREGSVRDVCNFSRLGRGPARFTLLDSKNAF